MTETRLITRETRPDLYALLDESRAANDAMPPKRRYPAILRFLFWCGEREWRIAALIAAAILIGSVLGIVLP